MPSWFSTAQEKKDDKVTEITPESLNKTLTDQKTELEAKLSELGSSIENHPTLKAMQTFLDEQAAARLRQQQQQQSQQQQQKQEKFENLDQATREYVDQTLQPIAQATLMQQGTEMRRNIFEDEEAFPYYTGSLKSKVDALLDAQPAGQRANPDIIRNVYKIVVFDNQKEINENKIKSRFSASSSAGTGTGAPGAGDKSAKPILTQQMKQVAHRMGMSDDEYATAMQELQSTGELD